MKRRFLIPEVIQLSAMDCGPASLKCLLDGFRIEASYDALRDSCRTDVDGTSIDELGRVARAAGLVATQIMIPLDHVLLPEARALPALAVFRHPNGNTHFSVIWSVHGGLVQMMDPAAGRVWRSRDEVLSQLYRHVATIPESAWRKWAGSENFLRVLRRRMRDAGAGKQAVTELIARALADEGWKAIAVLDAGTRTLCSLRKSVGRIPNVASLLARYLDDESAADQIPENFWTVRAAGDGKVSLRGAVLLQAKGVSPLRGPAPEVQPSSSHQPEWPRPIRPLRAIVSALGADGMLDMVTLGALALTNAAGLVAQALLLRAMFGLATRLADRVQLIGGMVALLVLLIGLFIERLASAKGIYRYTRSSEAGFRRLVLRKIPRLGDRYFQTRLPADVAERSHSIVTVRFAAFSAVRLVSNFFELVMTTAGIIWIDPHVWPYALAAAASALGVPLLTQTVVAGNELRVRVHTAGLGRFYLDTLLGVTAIRAHAAERSVWREHQALLTEWVHASLRLMRLSVGAAAVQTVLTTTCVALLLLDYIRHGDAGGALLLVYWALSMPVIAKSFGQVLLNYQPQRNALLRIRELLDAPEESRTETEEQSPTPGAAAIDIDSATVRLTSRVVLDEVSLRVAPGEHVAIVGPSGAGKSTLVGLLLGWSSPEKGSASVDGRLLEAPTLDELRRGTAWVDPAIQIWNRTLLDNVTYGADQVDTGVFSAAMAAGDLVQLLHSLPQGLQTPLGEGGGLVSGGEGQRVRLARAMCRTDARLVILDEPFRGLDRQTRAELLTRARRLWSRATLLCVTHDIRDTQHFDRVVVVEEGRIVEHASPAALASSEASRYAAMLRADAVANDRWWNAPWWRRLRIERGALVEQR